MADLLPKRIYILNPLGIAIAGFEFALDKNGITSAVKISFEDLNASLLHDEMDGLDAGANFLHLFAEEKELVEDLFYQSVANVAALPALGNASLIYFAIAEQLFKYWDGLAYQDIDAVTPNKDNLIITDEKEVAIYDNTGAVVSTNSGKLIALNFDAIADDSISTITIDSNGIQSGVTMDIIKTPATGFAYALTSDTLLTTQDNRTTGINLADGINEIPLTVPFDITDTDTYTVLFYFTANDFANKALISFRTNTNFAVAIAYGAFFNALNVELADVSPLNSMYFAVNKTQPLAKVDTSTGVVNITGNVAIGPIVPSSKMEANEDGISITPNFRLSNYDTTNDNASQFSFRSENLAGTRLDFANVRGIYSDHTTGAEKGIITFATRNGAQITERMRIDHLGRVAIGMTPVTSKFAIAGLPTSNAGLIAGEQFTQTATQLGGAGTTKVVCIV